MEQPTRIDELERKFGENPRRYFAALANEYRRNGELDQAIELCRRHLTEQRSHLSGHVVLGQALVEAGKSAEAWSVLRRALDLDPENFIALRLLGDLSVESREPEEARGFYRRALEIEPRNEPLLAAVAALETRHAPVAEPAPAEPGPAAVASAPEVPEPEPGLMLSHEFVAPGREAEPDPGSGTPEPEFVAPGAAWAETGPVPEPAAELPSEPPAAEPAITEPEPVAELVPESEPASVVDAEPEPPRAVLVSETMADLYLEQGHRAAAVDVLRELLSQRPADVRLRLRLAQLERDEPQARVTVRDLFARLGVRRESSGAPRDAGLAALFGDAQPGPPDAGADPLIAVLAPVQPSASEQELGDWISGLPQR